MLEILFMVLSALITFFASKKAGANDASAAMLAATAGAGTYYVTTQTDWGKSSIAWLQGSWDTLVSGPGGATAVGPDGEPILLPEGSELLTDEEGNVVLDENGAPLVVVKTPDGKGGWFETIMSVSGDVLKSWGGMGTAAVVGSATVLPDIVAAVKANPWPWLIGGGALLLLILR